LDNDWQLYPHQERAVLTALQTERHILALAMGSGKTLIRCVWAREMRHTLLAMGSGKTLIRCVWAREMRHTLLAKRGITIKIMIVCPVSTHDAWRRTAQKSDGFDDSSKRRFDRLGE
jgi:DNA helicase HerA-like ATPase